MVQVIGTKLSTFQGLSLMRLSLKHVDHFFWYFWSPLQQWFLKLALLWMYWIVLALAFCKKLNCKTIISHQHSTEWTDALVLVHHLKKFLTKCTKSNTSALWNVDDLWWICKKLKKISQLMQKSAEFFLMSPFLANGLCICNNRGLRFSKLCNNRVLCNNRELTV